MKPKLIEVIDFMFDTGDRNSKNPLQFFAYYNAVGWPKREWRELAIYWLNQH